MSMNRMLNEYEKKCWDERAKQIGRKKAVADALKSNMENNIVDAIHSHESDDKQEKPNV